MVSANAPIFLGHGLLAPLQRDQKNDFAHAGGVELVRSCVATVLGVQADSPFAQGELPWRPEFGARLYLLKHQKGPMLQAMATVYVTEALQRWEPRVFVLQVSASFDSTRRILTLRLLYDVIDRNVPANNVLFPGVEQTLDVAMAA